MAHLLIRHKVESYAKWRPVFAEQNADREAAGQVGDAQVFRSGDDPWEVLVLMEWDELERARQFAVSDATREAMQAAGVSDEPTFHFLQGV